jgi:LmbE family N-acetylglucosaminyl deacetylase
MCGCDRSCMLRLNLSHDPAAPLQILCLGAHSDDIEIGCGGTILQLLSCYSSLQVWWIVFSAGTEREREARGSAAKFLARAKSRKVIVKKFRDGFFPYEGAEIKKFFEKVGREANPDLIFTHYRDDRHQDHRTISDLTWNTWRQHLILEYEVPKYDGDFGTPNFFVELDKTLYRRKLEYIVEGFRSQRNKHWFSDETLLAVLRLRGMECRASSRHAEAFYSRKMVLGGC